jgi:epsilon-lactone hydrolase
MASWQAHLWSILLRHTFKKKLARSTSAQEIRAIMDRSLFKTPPTVKITPARLGQCDGEWVEPTSSVAPAPKILLYLHGGGYIACNLKTHRPYTTGFALRGFRVYAPAYRLAPEYRFPAGLDDAVEAYRALRREHPNAPVGIAGDSAGAGLALATMLRLRDAGDPLPRAAVLFSPFTDLAGTGASRLKNDRRCAMFHAAGLNTIASYYLPPGIDIRNPLVSPLFADFTGLPPMLIHVGADETLLDDSTVLAERARAAGVQVECKIWPVVTHVWQMLPMPEAKQSMDEAAAFLMNRYKILIGVD